MHQVLLSRTENKYTNFLNRKEATHGMKRLLAKKLKNKKKRLEICPQSPHAWKKGGKRNYLRSSVGFERGEKGRFCSQSEFLGGGETLSPSEPSNQVSEFPDRGADSGHLRTQRGILVCRAGGREWVGILLRPF